MTKKFGLVMFLLMLAELFLIACLAVEAGILEYRLWRLQGERDQFEGMVEDLDRRLTACEAEPPPATKPKRQTPAPRPKRTTPYPPIPWSRR